MSEPVEYIGYIELHQNEEVIVSIAVFSNPEIFTGEYYPITADYGEGSFADLLFKLKRGLEELKGGKNQYGN